MALDGCDEKLKELLGSRVREAMAGWHDEDIYAVSFYVYDDGDNPCTPSVTLGYNTEANVASEAPHASSEGEARWNFAFWLQNEELRFGGDLEGDGDAGSAEAVRDWVRCKGFPYYDGQEIWEVDVDDDACEQITASFVEVLLALVRELHETGFIRECFGRDLPVIIHELEYYEAIYDRNIRANGEEVSWDLVSYWVNDDAPYGETPARFQKYLK